MASPEIKNILSVQDPRGIPRWVVLALWLLAGVSLLAFLGTAPCNRSQEARVLVTAREMAQDGGIRWLLPTCNGELRVQKPPMACWAAAVTFLATGQVSELTGRLPSVLWAWLTLGALYWAGTRWFSRPVGLLAAGMLLTSFLFYRYGRLAETDIPATLAVTVAIIAFWRGLESGDGAKAPRRAALWCAVGGAATGLAFLAKQGPGAYPLLFALAYGIVQRNWKGLLVAAWAGVGPAILVAAPWYAYIVAKGYGHVFWSEAVVAAEGKDHGGGVLALAPMLVMATIPWFGLWPAGAILAWRDRHRPAGLALMCWASATFVPLLFVQNRQIHYLMPAMPPLMLLSAWAVEQTAKGMVPRRLGAYVTLTLRVLMVGAMVAGVAVIGWAAAMAGGFVHAADQHFAAATAVLGVLLLVMGLITRAPMRNSRPLTAMLRATAALAAVFVWLIGVWAVHLQPEDVHRAAEELQTAAGGRHLVFYGEPSLALVFQLGQTIPVVRKRTTLPPNIADDTAIVVESGPADPPASLPPPWQLAWRGGPAGHHYQLWLAPKNGTTLPSLPNASTPGLGAQ